MTCKKSAYEIQQEIIELVPGLKKGMKQGIALEFILEELKRLKEFEAREIEIRKIKVEK